MINLYFKALKIINLQLNGNYYQLGKKKNQQPVSLFTPAINCDIHTLFLQQIADRAGSHLPTDDHTCHPTARN